VLQCIRETLAGSKENMHKIAHTHGSSLISTKKLVSMGKLLTRCCRMAVAKALKICRSDAMWTSWQRNRPKPCHDRSVWRRKQRATANTGYTLSRQKEVRNACRDRETWRGQGIVCLIFVDFGAACTAQDSCSVRPPFFLPFFNEQKLGLGLAPDHRNGLRSGSAPRAATRARARP
jgi:hypothetical protein